MTANPTNISQLRENLDEDTSPTRFTNNQLATILVASSDINIASRIGWIRKAGRLLAEIGLVQRAVFGEESTTMVALKDAREYAMAMADVYKDLSDEADTGSAMIFGNATVEVITPSGQLEAEDNS